MSLPEVTEARRALRALRLEVPAPVADDLNRLVEAAFAAQEERQRGDAQVLEQVWWLCAEWRETADRKPTIWELFTRSDVPTMSVRHAADRLRAALSGRSAAGMGGGRP